MQTGLAIASAIVAAYLIGSLPFGLISARLFAGVDIRQVGSGNIGATNVARVLGAKFGLMVLVLDCAKGALPTLLLPSLVFSSSDPQQLHVAIGSGIAAIIGHMFPCWLGFRGGKGVATALGVILVLAPVASGIAFFVFASVFLLSRIVSLSSMAAALAFCGDEITALMPRPFSSAHWSMAAFSILVPLLIIARHRANIVRLWRGKEPKFQFGNKRKPAPKTGEQPESNGQTVPGSEAESIAKSTEHEG